MRHARPAIEQRPCFGAQHEVLHGPGAGAPTQPFLHELRTARLGDAGLADEVEGVPDHLIRDRHFADERLDFEDFPAAEDRGEFFHGRTGRPPGDFELLIVRRVVHEHLEHEAILLRLGQRVGAFLLDRVLGREDEERTAQFMSDPADGDLSLLHRFEQGRLRLRRGPVDFVREDDVREERPIKETELSLSRGPVLFDDFRAGDVRGHQVRRELNPTEIERQALRERADHQRFREAGDAFQDAVAPGEEGDEEFLDHRVLPDDHAIELALDVVERLLHVFDGVEVGRIERGLGHAGLG